MGLDGGGVSIRPRFSLTSWRARPEPNEVRFPLACGARARVVIDVDARGCQCGAAHAPSADQVAAEVWLSMQGLDAAPSGDAIEGEAGNDGA